MRCELGIALAPESRRDQGLCLNLPVGLNLNLPIYKRICQQRADLRRAGEAAHADQQIADLRIKTPTRHALASSLSGGNQQKIVIGKWLNHGAKLFIFDEPTVGVDVGTKAEIYRLFATLLREGRRHHPDLVLPAGSLRTRRHAACVPPRPAGRQPRLHTSASHEDSPDAGHRRLSTNEHSRRRSMTHEHRDRRAAGYARSGTTTSCSA